MSQAVSSNKRNRRSCDRDQRPMELTTHHFKLLVAVERGTNHMATAWDIANRMGYRPSRKAIPAVTQMCRAINRRFPAASISPIDAAAAECGDIGEYLVRIPPKDQWASAVWCLTASARSALCSNQDGTGGAA